MPVAAEGETVAVSVMLVPVVVDALEEVSVVVVDVVLEELELPVVLEPHPAISVAASINDPSAIAREMDWRFIFNDSTANCLDTVCESRERVQMITTSIIPMGLVTLRVGRRRPSKDLSGYRSGSCSATLKQRQWRCAVRCRLPASCGASGC